MTVNEAAVRSYGYSRAEFLQMTLKDIRPREDVAALLVSLGTAAPGTTRPGVWRHKKKDGTVIHVEITQVHNFELDGMPCGLVVAVDVTERHRTEAQLRQAQKMEAIGNLAGGVAHDFNNLLSIILSYAQLLAVGLKEGDPMLGDLDEILKAGAGAAALTAPARLAFSRQQLLQPVVLDLNTVVGAVTKMLRRVVGEDVELTVAHGPGLGTVTADPGQVEQVLMNLVVNARDAMPRGGQLTIETSNVELDAGYADVRPDLKPGRYVLLAVTDTGSGMDEATRDRVFEPFFTTKTKGSGTGHGPRDGVRHRATERRSHLGLQRAGRRNHGQGVLPAGGRGSPHPPPSRRSRGARGGARRRSSWSRTRRPCAPWSAPSSSDTATTSSRRRAAATRCSSASSTRQRFTCCSPTSSCLG